MCIVTRIPCPAHPPHFLSSLPATLCCRLQAIKPVVVSQSCPLSLRLSRMNQPHLIGNFASPVPLAKKALGPPRQIAYYSCFPGSTGEYEYQWQSRSALKFYSPPAAPFSFIKAPDKAAWSNECDYLDSLPQPEVEPIVASCKRAGCTTDLREADIITRRGALVKYVFYSLASLTSSLPHLIQPGSWRRGRIQCFIRGREIAYFPEILRIPDGN